MKIKYLFFLEIFLISIVTVSINVFSEENNFEILNSSETLGNPSKDNSLFPVEDNLPLKEEEKTSTDKNLAEEKKSYEFIGNMNEVVVKSNKLNIKLKDETVGVSVIDENEIKLLKPKNLFDVLKFERGFTLLSNGDEAMMKTASIRGGRSEEILVMLDGRQLNSPSLGLVDLNTINMENIESVEIYRDAAAAIFGNNSFSGMINLVSKTPTNNIPETIIGTKFGGYGEQYYTLNFAVNRNNNIFSLGAQKKDILGKLKNSSMSADNADFVFKKNISHDIFKFSGGFYNDITGDPYFGNAQKTNKNYYLNTDFEKHLTDMYIGINFYYNNEAQNYSEPSFSYNTDYLNQVANLNLRIGLSDNFFSEIGTKEENYKNENIINKTTLIDKSLKNQYAVLLYKLNFLKFSIIPSARFDNSEKYGTELSPKISSIYRPIDDFKFSLTVSKGFRYPTFNEAFYTLDSWFYKGNANLKTEHSLTSEFGVEFEPLKNILNLKTMYFFQTADDKIDTTWPMDSNTGLFTPQNILSAISSGFEFETTVSILKNFNLNIGYSYMENFEKNKDASNYRRTPYSPMNRLNTKLRGEIIKNLSFFVGGRYQTDSYSVASYYSPSIKIPELFFTDMGISYTTGDIELFFNIENLTDETYYFLPNYPMPGRKIYGGIKIKFLD